MNSTLRNKAIFVLVIACINFTNLSTNATSYQWDFMDGNSSTLTNPTHTYDQFGEFNVQLIATNAIGCSDTIVKIVEVIPDFNIYAPNTFTPDNNQHNQNFCLKGYGISDEGYYLSIFNRWGEIVFEGYHITEEWDGVTPNGEIAKDGPYVWKVKFRSVAGNTYEKIGHVNLLK